MLQVSGMHASGMKFFDCNQALLGSTRGPDN